MNKKGRNYRIAAMLFSLVFCVGGLVAGCSMKKPANFGISDAEITAGVREGLAGDPTLKPYTLTVTTEEGVVRLSGGVATSYDRDNAESIAAASRGVVSVNNFIRFGGKL